MAISDQFSGKKKAPVGASSNGDSCLKIRTSMFQSPAKITIILPWPVKPLCSWRDQVFFPLTDQLPRAVCGTNLTECKRDSILHLEESARGLLIVVLAQDL